MQLLVNTDVPGLAAASTLHAVAFGMSPVRRLGDSVIGLEGGGTVVHLLHKPAGSHAVPGALRDYARHWTPVHCDPIVDDLDPALARTTAAPGRRGARCGLGPYRTVVRPVRARLVPGPTRSVRLRHHRAPLPQDDA